MTAALNAIDDRWSLHIVRALAFGASRYTDILRAVGAPRDVLAARLKKLIASGIAIRNDDGIGYGLTEKGSDLARVLLVLKRWGDTWRDDEGPRLELVHTTCGQPLIAEICCQACQRQIAAGSIATAPSASSKSS